MVSSPSMRRHLCRCRNGVVALVVMASLPSPMRKRLAVVDDDGNGVTGDDNNDDFDDAKDFAVVTMALLPCHDGVVAIANVQASCYCQQ